MGEPEPTNFVIPVGIIVLGVCWEPLS